MPAVDHCGSVLTRPSARYRDGLLGAIPSLQEASGAVLGLLALQSPICRAAHLLATDELGFIDPADGFPDHVSFDGYLPHKALSGFTPADPDFLAVSATKTSEGYAGSPCAP